MPLRQTYASQLNDPLLASNTINTFTGPQNLIRATGNGAYVAQPTVIPVNYLKQGTWIRVHAFGTFSSLASATIALGLYVTPPATAVPATQLAITATTTVTGTPAAWPWDLWAYTIVRSTVVPSAMVTMTHGKVDLGTALTSTVALPLPGTAMATVNIDNTQTQELCVTATYGASSASNIIVLHGLEVEELTQM